VCLQSQLVAINVAGHDDIAEHQVDVLPGLENFKASLPLIALMVFIPCSLNAVVTIAASTPKSFSVFEV